MATRAFIFIETAVGKTKDVVHALRAVPGVSVADAVTGPYDVIAIVDAQDLSTVGDVVTGRIHSVNGIARTVTCLGVSAI